MTVYLLCYAVAYLFAKSGHYYLSGIGLMAAAIYLYYKDYKKSGNILHLRGLFALSWVGGQGIACLKLSKLSTEWTLTTWLCFLLAFTVFWLVFEQLSRYMGDVNRNDRRRKDFRSLESSVFLCVCGITIISFGCFLIEAMVLGYVPLLLRGVPHAYSYFHLRGIHYLTVSCVLVPALSVIWFCSNCGRDRGKNGVMLLMDIIALMVPILCVSRFQLIMAVILAILTYILMDHRVQFRYVAGAILALVPLYLILTVARSHDVTYLNGIFEMKNSHTPIFITQPYMYVANNYDNFNCLVEGLSSHSWGLKMAAPLWTFSGLKFVFPVLTDFPLFITKEELTTLTMFYDAYYDFGIVGVFGFSAIAGAVSYALMRMMKELRNPIGYVFYAQFAMYLLLSFFTTWFSNPTTWFYFAVTAVLAFVIDRKWGDRGWRSTRRGYR
ncbi:MAG: O-antigen polymerase [Clostridium sp.]